MSGEILEPMEIVIPKYEGPIKAVTKSGLMFLSGGKLHFMSGSACEVVTSTAI